MHGALEVHQIQALDSVRIPYQHIPNFVQDRPLRICDHIGGMTLKQGRFDEKPGLAGTAAADHTDIFVPGVLFGISLAFSKYSRYNKID